MTADWLNHLGLPAGGVTAAATIFGFSVAAEKLANKEQAMKDISRWLRSTALESELNVSQVIQRVFALTFGEKHFSPRCVLASALFTVFSTLAISIGILLAFHISILAPHLSFSLSSPGRKVQIPIGPGLVWMVVVFFKWPCFLFLAIMMTADYIALGKTRFFISSAKHKSASNLRASAGLFITDFVSSLLIWLAFVFIIGQRTARSLMFSLLNNFLNTTFTAAIHNSKSIGQTIAALYFDALFDTFLSQASLIFAALSRVALGTALFTSVWALLILCAIVALKVVIPIRRFTIWFFDINAHPIQAIGAVAGAFAIAGSIILTGISAIITHLL